MSDDIDDQIRAGGGPENDLDGADFDDVGGMDDEFEGGGQSFGDLMRNSPMFKIGIIIAVITSLVGAIVLFGGKTEQRGGSRVGRGSTIKEAPGGEVSPNYEQAVTEQNIADVETALKKGESALPVPVGTTKGRVGLEQEAAVTEDPLDRWRRIQEERQSRAQTQKPQLPNVDPNADAVDALTKSMAQQMESILNGVKIKEAEYIEITPADYAQEIRDAAAAAAAEKAAANTAQPGDEPAEIILPAGTIEYAQLLIEANSDAVGPVLAQIVSGPLSGSRMLGSFKTQEEFLVLSFDSVVIDGVVHRTDAVALDPETTGIGMVTDIDHRYFKRIVLPAAAKFIEGMAGAIADTGTTVTAVGDNALQETPELDTKEQVFAGMEEAASSVGDILDDEGSKTKPQIKVRAGTPIGILFVEPVLENQNKKTAATTTGG
jgi:intracellular multiplication protein IcmE